MDEEKIKRQAKELMDEFMKALEKLNEPEGEYGSERKQSLRDAKSRKKEGFRERALANAKSKDGYFLMEKKKW